MGGSAYFLISMAFMASARNRSGALVSPVQLGPIGYTGILSEKRGVAGRYKNLFVRYIGAF